MSKKFLFVVTILVLLSVVVSACAPAAKATEAR